ncbi:MAG: hypothetical protein QG656_98, partial [Candidatus Hydrogenedentes bacterium]|nr:hypothetical protein [Candidatus Hydrogenedentota bacterium]
EPPHNFILLGWLGVSRLFVSFYVVSRIREVPLPADRTFGRQSMGDAWRETYRILRHDSRVGWLVAARTFRTCGFLIGTYMTAVFIERCGLTNEQMWIPVVLATVPQIVNHIVSGWFVDRFGAKTAQTLSAFLVFLNSIQLFYCDTVGAFVVLYICTGFGGSLLMNSWTPLMMKLAPPATRAAYASTVTLAAAPGSVAVAILGMVLVYYSGFDHVFYVSMAGGLIASLLFFFKVPNLLQAPQE